jgi:hypothetical protein
MKKSRITFQDYCGRFSNGIYPAIAFVLCAAGQMCLNYGIGDNLKKEVFI